MLALLGASFARATDTGTVSGVVTDPSGAVIPEVAVRALNVMTGVTRNAEKFRRGMLATYGEKVYEDHPELLNSDNPPRELSLPVTSVLINKSIAMVGMPGEPFVDFQTNWRSRCPVQDCFLTGYSNGYFGYLPTIKAATEGGYGAASAATWIEPGAGEIMVDHALVRDLPDARPADRRAGGSQGGLHHHSPSGNSLTRRRVPGCPMANTSAY